MNKSQRAMTIGLYLNAALLAVVAMVLLLRSSILPSLPAAYGQQQPAIAGGAGVFVVPAQFSPNTFGCYLLDVDSQTLATYQFYPGEKQLRFLAARSFRYDRKVTNFNTLPAPADIKDIVEKQQQETRRAPNATRPSPESP